MPTDPHEYLGTRITTDEANEYLRTNAIIKDRIKVFVEDAIEKNSRRINRASINLPEDPERADKATNLCDDVNNVYVFSKHDFLRFFEGDPEDADPTHRALQFTHCLIILGSLPTNKDNKKKGEQTIVLAGCTQVNPTTYITATADGSTLEKLATEHPPRDFTVEVTDPVRPTSVFTVALTAAGAEEPQ